LAEAIGELDREDADELAAVAVAQVAWLEAAGLGAANAAERDPEKSPGYDAEALAVGDPWVDPDRPHSVMLDRATLHDGERDTGRRCLMSP